MVTDCLFSRSIVGDPGSCAREAATRELGRGCEVTNKVAVIWCWVSVTSILGVSRGVRARLTTTGYERSTTRCSSDASAGGSESANNTSCPMPTRFSGEVPRALRRRYADEGYCSRASWHAWEKSACRGGGCLGRCLGVKAILRGTGVGLDEGPLGGEGVRHQVRRVARGRTEGRRMVRTGRRRGGGFHAEMAQG